MSPKMTSFTLACSVGAFANVGIASYLFEMDTFWLLSVFSGIIVGGRVELCGDRSVYLE